MDEPPAAESGSTVQVSGRSETNEVIVRTYKQVPDRATPGKARVFSKIKLVAALKDAGRWVLVKTWIEGIPRRAQRGELRGNFARGVRGYYDYYVAAQNFREGNPLFAEAVAAIKDYARMSDEVVEAILSKCIYEEG